MAQRRSWLPRRRYEMVPVDEVFSEDELLELQKTKRELADTIITADNNLIGILSREDLERLLS